MHEKPFYLKVDLKEDEKFKSLDSKLQESMLFLRDQGYCIIDPQVDNAFLDQIVADCKSEYEKVEYGGAGRSRIENAFQFSENAKNLALNPHVLSFLQTAFGREPIPFQTLNFDKGSEQSTHSDTIHFNSYPYGFMCGAWVALEDVDQANGPLHYYPGSHKLPVFGLDQFSMHGASKPPSYDLYPSYEQGVKELIESLGLKKESVKLKKGQCLIWSANLLHGGDPITDQTRTRHSQVNHYYFEDCFYYTPMLGSPFNMNFHIRNPMNIKQGSEIGKQKMNEYASKSGIDVKKLLKAKKRSFFQKLFD